MRILQTGDLHLDINATKLGKIKLVNGINEVYKNRLNILRHIIKTGIENQVDYFVFPGDIFNQNRPYPQEYFDLDSILKPIKDKVLMLYGNHDNYAKKGCALQPFEQMGYKVALGLTTFDKFIYLAPWGTKLEDIDDAMRGEGVLCLHGGVKDDSHQWVQVEGEEGNYHLRDLQALGIHAIMLQHHHHQVELAPAIWYAGSPECFYFGEEHDTKGFLIWDINRDNDIRVTRYSTRGLYPAFVTFGAQEFLDYPDKGIDAYVRVKDECEEQQKLDIFKKMKEFSCYDYTYDLTSKHKNTRVFQLTGNTDQEILFNHLTQKQYKNVEKLLELDKQLDEEKNT